MTELSETTWDLGGLALGAGTPYTVLETDGLEDTADLALSATQGWGDGTFSGSQRLQDRLVTLSIGLRVGTTEAQRDALRAVMSPTANRLTERVLRWRHRGVTKRVEYSPAPGKSLSIAGDATALNVGYAKAVARLQVDDPIIYADTPVVTAFAVAANTTHTIVNAGSLTCVTAGSASLGAMSWTITAGAGGCTWPYVTQWDFPGELWLLAEELDAGDIVTVGPDRVTRVNAGARKSATVVGPDGCPIPTWPALRPLNNSIRMGAMAGTVSGSITTRGTW